MRYPASEKLEIIRTVTDYDIKKRAECDGAVKQNLPDAGFFDQSDSKTHGGPKHARSKHEEQSSTVACLVARVVGDAGHDAALVISTVALARVRRPDRQKRLQYGCAVQHLLPVVFAIPGCATMHHLAPQHVETVKYLTKNIGRVLVRHRAHKTFSGRFEPLRPVFISGDPVLVEPEGSVREFAANDSAPAFEI